MSDLPPSTSTFGYEVIEPNDELIKMIKQMVRRESEVMMNQMMKPQLEHMMIRICHSSIGPIMEDFIRRILQEKLEEVLPKYMARDQGEKEVESSSPGRRLTLLFRNEPSSPIYTGKEIKAKDGTPVVVELVDLDSGKVVESGPEAESKFKLVLLEGDDGYNNNNNRTSEVVDNNMVGERKGTKLGGNVVIQLEKGIGVVDNVKFVSSRTNMPQGVFKLGTRILGGPLSTIPIGEGISESFMVKDYRNEKNKKSEIPQLSDAVWKLNKIAKKGKSYNNLKEKDIHNVKDFLLQHFKDPEGLKCIAGMKNKDWEDSVNHARTCILDNNISCYIDPHDHNGVAFNLVDQVLGFVSGSNYIPLEKLSDNKKAEAKRLALYALENGKDILPFDDEDSLVSYLSSSLGSLNVPENSQMQNIDPQADPYFPGATVVINHGRGSPITIPCGEVATNFEIDEQPLGSQSSFALPDPDTAVFFHGLDDFLRIQGLEHLRKDYPNIEQRNRNSKPKADKPRVSNWILLVNRMRGSMGKKRVGLEKLPVRKRQKTDSVTDC